MMERIGAWDTKEEAVFMQKPVWDPPGGVHSHLPLRPLFYK